MRNLFRGCILSVVGGVLLGALGAWGADDAEVKQQLFEKVFGEAVQLDTVMRERVLAGKPGERHYLDRDGDGQPEEVWFLDTAQRHPEKFQPLLVRAIDEDGDLREGCEPDLDSDLYIADWKADGSVDAVLDYTDVDGDNDLDEMGKYFYGGTHGYFEEPVIRVWWSRDVGDDNLLWHDVGYSYDQTLCQYRTHFGGDEELIAFALPLSGSEWVPFFENPFLFYDHDEDGVTEEVLRMSGIANDVECVRHSFDADNDATWESPRDFDVSLTAWAPGAMWTETGTERGRSKLAFPDRFAETVVLRGMPSTPFLRFDMARQYAEPIVWERMILTWDEVDQNVDGDRYADADERWEGVIAKGNDHFPQVGGPSSGPVNKRYEVVMKPGEPARVYYHPTDHRVHLLHADHAWMEADLDLDRAADLRYDMRDTTGDGLIDRWEIDLDMDGKPEDSWGAGRVDIEPFGWNWASVSAQVGLHREENTIQALILYQRLMEACRKRVIESDILVYDGVAEMITPGSTGLPFTTFFHETLKQSDESLFYFSTVLSDVMIALLKGSIASGTFWEEFNRARATGDLARMTRRIERELELNTALRIADYKTLQHYRSQVSAPRVAWAQDWVPPNIGWESERVGYRVYWGQFDFFGKKADRLIYPEIGSQSYHDETEWGIDALNVGRSPGCGGATLYVNGESFPVRNPAGDGDIDFTKRLVSIDQETVTVELLGKKVGPSATPFTVQFLCSAFAGRMDTRIEVRVDGGGADDRLELGIGLTRLPEEELVANTELGVFGTWGFQTPAIGRIGMGIVFPAHRFVGFERLADENQVVIAIEKGKPVVYHIQCDWLRGHRFDRSPSTADWLETLSTLAGEVRMQ